MEEPHQEAWGGASLFRAPTTAYGSAGLGSVGVGSRSVVGGGGIAGIRVHCRSHFWPLAGLGAGLVFAVIFIGLASGASLVSIRVLVVKVEMRWPRSGPGHSATTAAPEDEKGASRLSMNH